MVLRLANTSALLERASLGSDIRFPLVVDKSTGDLATVDGDESIQQSIMGIISTVVGERVMNEDIGTTVPLQLFEDPVGVADVLPPQVVEAIRRFEPRVVDVQARAQPFKGETEGVRVHVSWRVRGTSRRGSLSYDAQRDQRR